MDPTFSSASYDLPIDFMNDDAFDTIDFSLPPAPGASAVAYDENDFLLGANELVELAGNDLEDWLGVDDDSPFTEDWAGAPSQLDFSFNYAQNDTSNNYGLHDYPPDMNHDSAVYILPEPEENVLLITIPDHLQQNSAFNSLPSFALDQQTLSSISSTSAGHHGAYMQANRSNIVRRPPLQVIQHITGNQMEPKVFVQTLKTDPAVGKRKQKFHLTREDGIEFSDIKDDIIVKEEDTPPNPDPSAKRRRVPPKKYMFDDMFVWPAGEEERKIVRVDKPIDESQRCQLCKKVFKKLAQHKCKWLMGAPPPKKFKCMRCFLLLDTPSLLAAHAKVHELACDGCLKTYKSKKGLLGHFQKCFPNRFTAKQQASTMTTTPKEMFKPPIAKKVVAEKRKAVPKKNPARASKLKRV